MAHSDKNFVYGFSGILHEEDIQQSTLNITIELEKGSIFHKHHLKKNPMLSLSKKEKFEKFSALFPNDDPEDLLMETRNIEYSASSADSFEIQARKLERIVPFLKCIECDGTISVNHDKDVHCSSCGKSYPYQNNQLNFLTD